MAIDPNAETRLVGIFGYPLGHTLSPRMQNRAFAAAGVNMVYLAFPVEPERIGAALEAVRALGMRGVNLTVPHKERALPLLDALSPEAEQIGAVNTVVNEGGRLRGFNTDAPGFICSLREDLGLCPEGLRVLLLGAGGAARAVAWALGREGAARVWVANRTASRARALCDELSRRFPRTRYDPLELEAAWEERWEVDLVVNATTLGMRGEALRVPAVPPACRFYDLIYNPPETPWLAEARRRGHPTAGGMGMLVHQGALSFELWTGRRAPLQAMRTALWEALARREA